jgi:hypothetical protein
MKLQLLASDFRDADFGNLSDCPFARAGKRLDSGVMRALTYGLYNDFGNILFDSNGYFYQDFALDRQKAEVAGYSHDVVVRELDVIPM